MGEHPEEELDATYCTVCGDPLDQGHCLACENPPPLASPKQTTKPKTKVKDDNQLGLL